MKLTMRHLLTAATLLTLLLSIGCSDRDPAGLEIARAKIDPLVFDDDYGDDVYFQAFMGTYLDAVKPDSVYAFQGDACLKITIPPEGSALGAYSGGVLTSVAGRDKADFNALTFYARSNVASTLNLAGFGNDNTGETIYETGRTNIPLTTEWTFVVIPIPDPAKLIAERGLFTFAEGWEDANPMGHEVYVDEIRFANLGNITDPFPVMSSVMKQAFIGSTISLGDTFTRFTIDGAYVVVGHMPSFFDFTSTDPSVAIVENGAVKVVGTGNTTINAFLHDAQANGAVAITGYQPPTGAAASPTVPAGDVISMFSDVYQDVHVDSWNPYWGGSTTGVADYVVDGSNTKMYTTLNWVGIVFTSQTVDASAMTHLHLDVYAPEGTGFNVKVVAFDGDGGSLIAQQELAFDATTTPAFTSGDWVSLDIPLADYDLITDWTHIGQIVLVDGSGDTKLVLVDNLYWHR